MEAIFMIMMYIEGKQLHRSISFLSMFYTDKSKTTCSCL